MLEEVLKTYRGVRLSYRDRWLIWADDTNQWEVYDKAQYRHQRVVPIVLATSDLADAIRKFTEGLDQ